MTGTALNDMPRPQAARRMRHDPLAEFDRAERPPVDVRQAVRTVMGFVLLAAGLFVCLWFLHLIHAAVFHTEKLDLLARLVPVRREELVLTLPAGKVELPPGLLRLLAYLALLPLVAIGAKIGISLVKEGCWLLRHERVTVVDEAPSNFDSSSTDVTDSKPAIEG